MAAALRGWLCACLLAVLPACSCGNAPCQHLRDAEASLKNKAGGCALTFTPFDEKRCEDKSGECTNSDYQLIDEAASCLENQPVCTAGEEQLWLAQVVSCRPSVSAACSPAIQ